MTPTTSAVSAVSPFTLDKVKLVGDGGPTSLSFNWLNADFELRTCAQQAPVGGMRVAATVEWKDGLRHQLTLTVFPGDQHRHGNLLAAELRSVATRWAGVAAPEGKTLADWTAELKATAGDLYEALVAKAVKVLAHVPEDAPAARFEHADEVDDGDDFDDDPWGGEDAIPDTVPAPPPPANDVAPVVVEVAPAASADEPAPVVAKPVLQVPQGKGFFGSKYVRGRDVAETAKLMRAELKDLGARGTKEIPKGTSFAVSVRRYSGGQSIDVRVTPPGDVVVVNVDSVLHMIGVKEEEPGTWPIPYFNAVGVALIEAASRVHGSYNRDDSDSMRDHFDVDFYGSVVMDADVVRAQRAAMQEALCAVLPAAKKVRL